MIPDSRGGRIVNVSPADPVCSAALENLARVLSIEWARFGIRPTAIASGSDEEAAWLAAFLASPAGDYYSGAVLGARPERRAHGRVNPAGPAERTPSGRG